MFSSKDGLTVTADMYVGAKDGDVIVMCHQASFSRGEYVETAQKLAAMGYNCLALDQRSGDQVNGIQNETNERALEKGLPTGYLDAEQDILAAIDFTFKNTGKKVILMGSSYSASLALKIGAKSDKVKAVIAFSPGEYFGDQLNLAETIKGMSKPVFITSSKKEAPAVKGLSAGIQSEKLVQFVPTVDGFHGSKALWEEKAGHEEYWRALKAFLAGLLEDHK
ncbi:MAG: dienelactone hydrolase family protein [Bacteroidia bacterium]|nr:dienelactone hydrolase family protein [Bacteroidia bacterium]